MPRKGRPKTSGNYANRSDLQSNQPVRAPSGLPYGQRQALEGAQRAMPLPGNPPPAPQAPPGGLEEALAAAATTEFDPVGIDAPSDRPHEPVTTGLPVGPGPGPEVLPFDPRAAEDAETLVRLRALYAEFPSTDLRELIEDTERGATF